MVFCTFLCEKLFSIVFFVTLGFGFATTAVFQLLVWQLNIVKRSGDVRPEARARIDWHHGDGRREQNTEGGVRNYL